MCKDFFPIEKNLNIGMLFVSSNRRTLHQNKLLELGLAFNPNK